MFGQDRDSLRRHFFQAWDKARTGQPLEPLERLIAEVVGEHPEYHALLADEDAGLARDYTPEGGQSNPFLHMGMHIALREQMAAGQPPGVREAFQDLVRRTGDAHAAEHHAMECLGETLWTAQRTGTAPDERAYLACLKRLGGAKP
ncbi:DUF1841 family protein [Ectothiorhodospiraceae bacterium 2226]|nr:DUF1841 family protein [Ectothiorhodospiraceae bacterium 2226]